MFKKVQLRLTFFCALATGLILFIMTCICLAFSESSMRSQNYTAFQNNTSSILSYIDSQKTLSHTWLSQMEHNYNLLINILDGGSPLLYNELHPHSGSQELLQLARDTASGQYGLNPKASHKSSIFYQYEAFQITDGGGSDYYVMAALMPRDNSYLDVIILQPAALLQKQFLHQRLFFAAGSLIAWTLLIVFAWFFTGHMLRPIEESRKSQIQFIASASHELRSPLAVILSALSAAKTAGVQEQPRFFGLMESEGQRMSRLIDDMLMLASSDNKTWSMHPAPAELDTLLLETYEKYEPAARKKQLHLKVSLPDTPLSLCLCDKERIGQTLSILIDNAFSYTPEGGTICLSLKPAEKYFEISVADNGPGIPDSQKNKIFDRFYRADNARSSRQHFGLGLCIAKEIVLLHRGKLTITDTPGGGATFTLMLPGETSGK